MEKKDVIFLAASLFTARQFPGMPTEKTDPEGIKTYFSSWYHLLAEIHDEISLRDNN